MKWTRTATGRSCRRGSFLHFLQQSFEAIDVLRPEGAVVRDPVDERLHPARFHAVEDAAPLAPAVHQTGVFQGGEMLRDRRLRDVEARGEVLHRRFAARERLEDRPAAGVRQRLEDLVLGDARALHERFLSMYLLIIKHADSPARHKADLSGNPAAGQRVGRPEPFRHMLQWDSGLRDRFGCRQGFGQRSRAGELSDSRLSAFLPPPPDLRSWGEPPSRSDEPSDRKYEGEVSTESTQPRRRASRVTVRLKKKSQAERLVRFLRRILS